MMIEHATARRLERSGIALTDVAATLEVIDRLPIGPRRRAETRRLEMATGGLLQVLSHISTPHDVAGTLDIDLDDDLVYAAVRLDDGTVWEADSLCMSPEGIPMTVVQGVDGIPLRSLVDHQDLPDATLAIGKETAAPHALFATGQIVCEPLPVPTHRDRRLQRRAMARFLRDERLATVDRSTRIQWAIKGLLLLGAMAAAYWLAAFSAIGWHGMPDRFQMVCGAIITMVPVLTAWNVYEGNPLIHHRVQRPATEASHRQRMDRDHQRLVGRRDRIDWIRPERDAIL